VCTAHPAFSTAPARFGPGGCVDGIEQIPLLADSANVIISSYVFNLGDDKLRVLREVCRALKPWRPLHRVRRCCPGRAAG
jgi:hypothetical protein